MNGFDMIDDLSPPDLVVQMNDFRRECHIINACNVRSIHSTVSRERMGLMIEGN